MPVSVATQSKAKVCGCSTAEIVGSNPTSGMEVCRECCVLLGRRLYDEMITRQEESYGVSCVWVWSRNLKKEEPTACVGPQRQRKKKLLLVFCKGKSVVLNDSLDIRHLE